MHVCWGNYEGPHHHDVPMERLLPIVLKAKPQGLLFEGANPRHAHEWTVFRDAKIPEDKVLIPGVLATTTNYIEHPLLVAERIERYATSSGAIGSSPGPIAASEHSPASAPSSRTSPISSSARWSRARGSPRRGCGRDSSGRPVVQESISAMTLAAKQPVVPGSGAAPRRPAPTSPRRLFRNRRHFASTTIARSIWRSSTPATRSRPSPAVPPTRSHCCDRLPRRSESSTLAWAMEP